MALVCFSCLISTLYACLLVICSPIFKLLDNSLNFEAKINFNTTRQNDLKWKKHAQGSKFYLEHFNGPPTKFICDSLYKHPVCRYLHENQNFGTFSSLNGHLNKLSPHCYWKA